MVEMGLGSQRWMITNPGKCWGYTCGIHGEKAVHNGWTWRPGAQMVVVDRGKEGVVLVLVPHHSWAQMTKLCFIVWPLCYSTPPSLSHFAHICLFFMLLGFFGCLDPFGSVGAFSLR